MTFKLWDRVNVKDVGAYKMGFKGIIIGLTHFNDRHHGIPDLAILKLDKSDQPFKALVCNLKRNLSVLRVISRFHAEFSGKC